MFTEQGRCVQARGPKLGCPQPNYWITLYPVMTDKSLKIVQGSTIMSTTDNGQEPSEWKVVHYANVGSSEEFVGCFSGELPELIDASLIFDPQRQELKEAIITILMEGLIPAFEHLKRIRASVGQQMPVLNRMQLYEDFSRVLWHGYKDLMPRATILTGFDMGFLFRNDADFEKGAIDFNKQHPSLIMQLCDHLRNQRTNWQNGLSKFRNHFLEHRKEEQNKFGKYYQPGEAEVLFDSAWRTMSDVLAVCIESHFPASFSIEEIPMAERIPIMQRRFRFVRLALPAP